MTKVIKHDGIIHSTARATLYAIKDEGEPYFTERWVPNAVILDEGKDYIEVEEGFAKRLAEETNHFQLAKLNELWTRYNKTHDEVDRVKLNEIQRRFGVPLC